MTTDQFRNVAKSFGRWSVLGQSPHFSRRPAASSLPRSTDIVGASRHVSNVPMHEVAALQPAAREQEPRGR
jgi:hypothetical protein